MLNKYRLLLFSLPEEAFWPICIQITGCIWWEKLKVPTSLHLICIFIKSIQKPIYIQAIFTTGFSFTHALFSLYLYLSLPFLPCLPLTPSFSFSLSLFSSICLSCHSISRVSLLGVLAAVSLQLLAGHTGSTAWALVVVRRSLS